MHLLQLFRVALIFQISLLLYSRKLLFLLRFLLSAGLSICDIYSPVTVALSMQKIPSQKIAKSNKTLNKSALFLPFIFASFSLDYCSHTEHNLDQNKTDDRTKGSHSTGRDDKI